MKVWITIILLLMSVFVYGQTVKCDAGLIKHSRERLSQLSVDDIRAILGSMSELCHETGLQEDGRALLLLLLDNHTSITLDLLDNEGQDFEREYLIRMLATPVFDLVNMKALINRVKTVPIDQKLSQQIAAALTEAERLLNQ